jgi:hypothetical protein
MFEKFPSYNYPPSDKPESNEQKNKQSNEQKSKHARSAVTRRDFLKKSVKGLVGLTLMAQLPKEVFGQGQSQNRDRKSLEIKKYPEVKEVIEAEILCIDLLAKNQGIFYAETHNDNPDNEQFMIENLEKFRQAGVTVIAIEMVDSEDQKLIDDFYDDPEKNKEALVKYTKSKLGRFPLIDAARKAGIKVIGIDMKARDVRQPGCENIKSKDVNQWWADQVKKEMANHLPGEKYIVYGGVYHSRKDGTGVNNFLEIPSIVPINPNEYPKPFFALKASTKIIPCKSKRGDYCRVYAKGFDQFCESSMYYYEEESPEISRLYLELKDLILDYLKNENVSFKKKICTKIDTLFSKVEEYDKEYLIQLRSQVIIA